MTDPLGHAWSFAYTQHLMTQETDRNGLSFYFAYDGFGEDAFCVRTWGDGGIYDHVLDYDKVGKVTAVTNSVGETTTYLMNAVGCVVKVVDPLGAAQVFEYDEQTLRKTKEIDPVGGETTWAYDARGNCTQVVTPTGAKTITRYNDLDLPAEATDEGGGSWQWTYDRVGHLVFQVDPTGRTKRCVWRDNLLASVAEAGAEPTHLEYDEAKNAVGLRRADYAASFVYANLGLLVRSAEGGRGAPAAPVVAYESAAAAHL